MRICFSVLLLAVVLICGCLRVEPQALMVPPTIPVRLAEPVEGVAVWVKMRDGEYVRARADLFAGLYVVADPGYFTDSEMVRMMQLRRETD